MSRLQKIELSEFLPRLPETVAHDARTADANRVDDLFVCALGFEDRCLTLPIAMVLSGYRARHALYLQYETNQDDNAIHAPELIKLLRALSEVVDVVRLDEQVSPDLLTRTLGSFDPVQIPTVTIDISVMSNRFILRALRCLLSHNINLRVIYSEADVYHPTEEEYLADPSRWTNDPQFGTEHGVAEIVPLSEFPGGHLDPLPDFLMVFPSFKPDRARAVISFVDQSLAANPGKKVLWFLGLPHLEEDAWRLNAMREINQLTATDLQVEVSTFDYKSTLRALEIAYAERSTYFNISVAPFGSKLQAIAVGLFCMIHPDVRIISAKPKEYGVRFSEGCKRTWVLDFGSTESLRDRLLSVGELRIEP